MVFTVRMLTTAGLTICANWLKFAGAEMTSAVLADTDGSLKKRSTPKIKLQLKVKEMMTDFTMPVSLMVLITPIIDFLLSYG